MRAEDDAAMSRLPVAPSQATVKLRGDYASAAPDFRVAQNYDSYTADEHAIWRTLYERQLSLMPGHAAPEFLEGLRLLGADAHRIPVLEEASAVAMGFPHDLLESPASRAMFGGVQVEKPQWR